jgi:hypothetical protein
MHRIGRDKPTLVELKNISKEFMLNYLKIAKPEYKHMGFPITEFYEKDIVIFVFGEIDIRSHYGKQIQKGRNKDSILNVLVDNYIDTILLNRFEYPNVNFVVQSVIPPTDEKNYKEPVNKEYPITGTIEDRIEATIEINKLLKEKCLINNLLFIDISTYYQNDETEFPISGLCPDAKIYTLDPRIKDDNVHVYIDYPQGIEFALKNLNIPSNIKPNIIKRKNNYMFVNNLVAKIRTKIISLFSIRNMQAFFLYIF